MTFDEFKKELRELTDNNDHTGAALLLVNRYGSPFQRRAIEQIAERHEENGMISEWDQRTRDSISRSLPLNRLIKL